MLIDSSYFLGPLTIAQLGQEAVVNDLNNFIDRFEPVILEAALGYDFYQAFLDGINVGSDEIIDQRWLDLLNGIAFTNLSQIKKKFFGFAGDNQNLLSPLANFIYYEYMVNLHKQATGSGIKKSDSENSSNASPNDKLANAYNEGVKQIRLFWEFMWTDSQKQTPVYPEFDYRQVYGYNYGYGYFTNLWNEQLYSFEYINPLF